MSVINDGGPAFPAPAYAANITDKGMTLRDYFAAQALAGLLYSGVKSKGWEETIAYYSYKIADAMLVRREVKP
jgi:hypothetical protein